MKRIAVCTFTGRRVLQEPNMLEPDGWLCLHNDLIADDERDCVEFEESQNGADTESV